MHCQIGEITFSYGKYSRLAGNAAFSDALTKDKKNWLIHQVIKSNDMNYLCKRSTMTHAMMHHDAFAL
ncbi:hypothetical protein [Pectobacterium versatile]|uniref:hypothetical protein n=1 Tax=Pectobacterium versatile TaxID=2488639 RepID=UPI001CF37355|nr:hypothetical protein [Pectobacterium versatile]MCA6924747.1 hypothetical protein [Pectobacterium versatile]MCH5081512.1 hypothetical protein [Pectobacterium versatile]